MQLRKSISIQTKQNSNLIGDDKYILFVCCIHLSISLSSMKNMSSRRNLISMWASILAQLLWAGREEDRPTWDK